MADLLPQTQQLIETLKPKPVDPVTKAISKVLKSRAPATPPDIAGIAAGGAAPPEFPESVERGLSSPYAPVRALAGGITAGMGPILEQVSRPQYKDDPFEQLIRHIKLALMVPSVAISGGLGALSAIGPRSKRVAEQLGKGLEATLPMMGMRFGPMKVADALRLRGFDLPTYEAREAFKSLPKLEEILQGTETLKEGKWQAQDPAVYAFEAMERLRVADLLEKHAKANPNAKVNFSALANKLKQEADDLLHRPLSEHGTGWGERPEARDAYADQPHGSMGEGRPYEEGGERWGTTPEEWRPIERGDIGPETDAALAGAPPITEETEALLREAGPRSAREWYAREHADQPSHWTFEEWADWIETARVPSDRRTPFPDGQLARSPRRDATVAGEATGGTSTPTRRVYGLGNTDPGDFSVGDPIDWPEVNGVVVEVHPDRIVIREMGGNRVEMVRGSVPRPEPGSPQYQYDLEAGILHEGGEATGGTPSTFTLFGRDRTVTHADYPTGQRFDPENPRTVGARGVRGVVTGHTPTGIIVQRTDLEGGPFVELRFWSAGRSAVPPPTPPPYGGLSIYGLGRHSPPVPPPPPPTGGIGAGLPPPAGGPPIPPAAAAAIHSPNVPPNLPMALTKWQRFVRWMKLQADKLPAERLFPRYAPESTALPIINGARESITAEVERVIATLESIRLRSMTQEQVMAEEWRLTHSTAPYAQGLAGSPAPFRDYQAYRAARFQLEQAAALDLGMDPLPEVSQPYVPRMVRGELQTFFRTHNSLHNELSESVRSFQRSRTHATMLEGVQPGPGQVIEYIPFMDAVMLREFTGVKLIETAKMMRRFVDEGILHPTAAAAEAARMAGPGPLRGPVVRWLDAPGKYKGWWVRSQPEALLLKQRVTSLNVPGGWRAILHWMKYFFRDLNLVNPLPHYAKNMLPKYIASGGSITRLLPDQAMMLRGVGPEMARFKGMMPFGTAGKTAEQLVYEQMSHGPAVAGLMKLHRLPEWSQHQLFTRMDPAIKFARWRQYTKKGLSDARAANNVTVDLIDYGLRGDWVDFMKLIPNNYFVPWRVGSVLSFFKQASTRHWKFLAFVTAVDYLREARYRQTGRWMHLPWDYVTAPLTKVVEDPKSLAYLIPATLIFGPGGSFGATLITDFMRDLALKGDWDRAKFVFWGLVQFTELPKQAKEFAKGGDPRHLLNAAFSVVLGEHSAVNYGPRRWTQFLPKSLPGLKPSPMMQDALAKLKDKQERRDRGTERRKARPSQTVEEYLRALGHHP